MSEETFCSGLEDGIHCEHWYDGRACCDCGDNPPLTEEDLHDMSISRNCHDGEHQHCNGILKFANAENLDDCIPCDCGCHPGSKEEQDAGIIRAPHNGWAIRND